MHSYILLDRSGSMVTNWIETIGALNGYVEDLAANPDTKNVKVSLFTFDATSG